jgi:hypothetical protein
MTESTSDVSVPGAMPVLGRGKHSSPARGACFMEYTALLAGEPHDDSPGCVDGELAAVLRGANDKLSDDDRPLLVPLLGRAIGLSVGPPPTARIWCRPASVRRQRRAERARYQVQALRLRRVVSRRFMAALGPLPTTVTNVWLGSGEEVSWVFWDLMDHPARLRTSEAYVRRLVDRLDLLHSCYEQAMDELGIPRAVTVESVPCGVTPVAD